MSPVTVGSVSAPVTDRRVSTHPAVLTPLTPRNGVSSRASSVPLARIAACRSASRTCPVTSNEVPSLSHAQLSILALPPRTTTRVGMR